MDRDAGVALWNGGYVGLIFILGWCAFQTFNGWDRNLDGLVTISDWRGLVGATATRPYEWAHSLFPGLFQFFELSRPTEATWRTAAAGVVWAYVFAVAAIGAVLVGIHTLVAFIVHWRGEKPSS